MRKLLVAVALAVVGCQPGREPQTARRSGEIPIGVYAALTGPEAAFGTATVQGEQLAADQINAAGGLLGRKIHLYIEDDQGKAEEAASVVTKLITSNSVIALLGENSSNQSLAAAPICQSSKIPMVSPSSTNPAVTQKGDYIFRVCFTDPYQGKALASFVRKTLRASTAGVLVDRKNDYSVGLAEFFTKEFTAMGGKVVAEQSYTGGDSEFRPQLTTIKAAAPEVLFLPGFYTDVGQIAIQARDSGITVPFVGGDGWDSPTVIQIGGKSVDNSYFSDHYFVGDPRPVVQKFVTEIRKRSGKNPEANSALGYDAMQILAAAIRKTGSLDGQKIRDALASTSDYQGVSGTITMGPTRDPIKPVAIIKIENGQMNFAGWVRP